MEQYNIFQNPTNEYRGKPFWSWNGKLDKEELIRQIHILKEMGMGGFFMHSRVGLETAYLGDEWFDLINSCTNEAEKLGMEAYIYDEDRWPSGTAGGMITKKSENRMKFILMHIDDDVNESADVIATFECELDGINYNEKSKRNKIWFEIVEFPKQNFYNGFTYADTLRRETTDEYIKATHQKYKEKCGMRIGTTIKGVFTDEPHRGHVLCDSMYSGFALPYTEALFDTFQDKWGYDLKDSLPELFLRKNGEKVSPVKWHYMETIQQMFLDNFAKPIHNWCKKNNMIFTGHVLHEDSLSAQTIMQGSLMRFYEYLDYPGIDVLGEQNINYCIAKQLSSVAHQLGQKWLLSELYGCTGWQMNFECHKNVGDWQALMGINVRCHHLSWYTMKGESKRDYPASIFHQSAWYKDYKYVEDYFSRIGVFLDQGDTISDCLVISPIESVWCQIYANWSNWLSAKDEDILMLEEHYKKLYNDLLESNVNFDFVDEEMLSRLYGIDKTILTVGKANYKKVVISGMLTMRKTTLDILNEFAKNGGEIIVFGDLPSYIDAIKADVTIIAKTEEFTKENIEKLKNHIAFADNDNIFIETKADNDNYYIMMLNTDRKNALDTKIKLNVNGNIDKWCARSGERYSVENISSLHFEAGEEKLFVISKTKNELPKLINDEYVNQTELKNIIGYELSEPNICVLDMARCIIDGEVIDERDILKIDRKLREKYHLGYRGGEMIQPWFVAQRKLPILGKIKLEYDFFVDKNLEDIELVVENADETKISINDTVISKICEKWIDVCFDKLKVKKELLKQGKNTITLEFDFKENSNLEAIYLLGDFGVAIDKTKLTLGEFPKYIGFGELKEYGLPFYSGKITYKFKNDVIGNCSVQLDNMCGAACVKINNSMVAFSPYETKIYSNGNINIELILTRRNTFGPLHQKNMIVDWYGPENFVTDIEDYSEEFCLYPMGISKAPVLKY